MEAESKRKLILKEKKNVEQAKKWKNFTYGFNKALYFMICSPFGFTIYYILIYLWIYFFPNTFTPFSLLFILLDLFFIYSPRGVDRKYQKYGFGVTHDKNVHIQAHKKDLLLIPSSLIRDFLFSYTSFSLTFSSLVGSFC